MLPPLLVAIGDRSVKKLSHFPQDLSVFRDTRLMEVNTECQQFLTYLLPTGFSVECSNKSGG